MKSAFIIILLSHIISLVMTQNSSTEKNKFDLAPLTESEKKIIINKGTEQPFTGLYYLHFTKGTYVCKQCNLPLFKSNDKFDAHCGWPSFDDEIYGAVKKNKDPDGVRTEIKCSRCGAHLGHIFLNEGFTIKNKRYCVNSISLNFKPDNKSDDYDENSQKK